MKAIKSLLSVELSLKPIRGTEKELPHTEVYASNRFLGYFIKNNSLAARKNENWNFVSRVNDIPHFYSITKKELLTTLLNFIN